VAGYLLTEAAEKYDQFAFVTQIDKG